MVKWKLKPETEKKDNKSASSSSSFCTERKLAIEQKDRLLNERRYVQKNISDKGLISKTHEELIQVISKKKKKKQHQIKIQEEDVKDIFTKITYR